jgi:hypothetical protein
MCIVSSQACTLHELWKVLHFQNNELSKPQICEISKGVRKPILKFPHKAIIRTSKCGNSFISLHFPHNALLESPVNLVTCRQSRQPCSIDPSSASQVEALDVEIRLSSQGSRIVSPENHPSCIRSWPVLITFKSSESSKEVRPGSIEAFCYASLCCYRKREVLYNQLFSFCSPLRLIN